MSSDKAKSLSESIATVRDAPGLAWWVIALIIAGAVLLLLLIVAYVLYRRNRQKTTRLRAQLASQPGGSGYDDGKRRGGTHRA